MANFMNPYEFIQPLLTSPVQNINAGIQAGTNLAQLGNQFVKMREETKKLRAANEAYNALMSPGATTLDEPLTVDKMVQLHAAGVPLEPIIKLQAQAKKDIANQTFAANLKERMAPVVEERFIPEAGIGEESVQQVSTPAKAITPEELIMMRMAIPEFQNEAAKEIGTLATLKRAERTAEIAAARDAAMQLYRDKMAMIAMQNADTNARRLEIALQKMNEGQQGTFSVIGTDEDGKPIFMNNKTRQTFKGDEKLFPKPSAKSEKPGQKALLDMNSEEDATKTPSFFDWIFNRGKKEKVISGLPADAKMAPDGKYYRPDPGRPGKWILLTGE